MKPQIHTQTLEFMTKIDGTPDEGVPLEACVEADRKHNYQATTLMRSVQKAHGNRAMKLKLSSYRSNVTYSKQQAAFFLLTTVEAEVEQGIRINTGVKSLAG